VVVDTGTAILVWVIGRTLFDRRTALAAGLLYALSPLALISSARIGQDPVITFLGIGGLALLVRLRGAWPALAAGALLGLALWVKYPAAYFLPVYLLAAPRRAGYILVAAAASFGLLLVPFHDQWRLMYEQTVTFQRTRWAMQTSVRVETLLVYWLVLNVPALIGLWWTRRPVWLVAGFCLGAVFVLPTQVYYHYFVPIVPFAALLGARSVAALVRWNPPRVAMAAALVLGVWAAIINLGGSSPLFVTAARFSSIQPTLSLLRTHTHAHQPVLADRFEYAYLAGRPALRHYFWNVGVLVRARYLERKMYRSGAVILSHGASSGYPAGFLGWLNKHYRHVETPATTIWLTQKRAG
jgi:4-amino-4-deoxy-L-arabinose transferase-like glycosyltransferase